MPEEDILAVAYEEPSPNDLDSAACVEYRSNVWMSQRGIDPAESFAWKIEDRELLTEQISLQSFEAVAESNRDDAEYASQVLDYRARRRVSDTR